MVVELTPVGGTYSFARGEGEHQRIPKLSV